MTRTVDEWAATPLAGDVVLVVGWRRGAAVQAGRIALHQTMAEALREWAAATLSVVGGRRARSFEATAALEEDEVFPATVDQLPGRKRRRGEPDLDVLHPSAVLEVTAHPGDLDVVAPQALRGRSFLFYAAVFERPAAGPIAFVKRHNPALVARTGAAVGIYGRTLRRATRPIMTFAEDFDLVIEGSEIAILSSAAIVSVFADIALLAAGVPALIAELGTLPLRLGPAALSALEDLCQRRRLRARHLQRLLERPYVRALTPDRVRGYLAGINEDTADYFDASGDLVVSEENVDRLLEVLEQAHYRGGLDDELWRAERASRVV